MNISTYKRNLERYDVDNKQFEKEKKKLSKRFNKEASDIDTLWSLFNLLLIKYAGDYHTSKMIYYEMALFLDDEGRNSIQMGEASRKMELTGLKQQGIKKVKICASKNGCKECQKQNEKTYLIDDALEKMPLPIKKCTHHLHNDKFGFCRCCWLGVID